MKKKLQIVFLVVISVFLVVGCSGKEKTNKVENFDEIKLYKVSDTIINDNNLIKLEECQDGMELVKTINDLDTVRVINNYVRNGSLLDDKWRDNILLDTNNVFSVNPNYVLEMIKKENIEYIYLWNFESNNIFVSYESDNQYKYYEVKETDNVKLKSLLGF